PLSPRTGAPAVRAPAAPSLASPLILHAARLKRHPPVERRARAALALPPDTAAVRLDERPHTRQAITPVTQPADLSRALEHPLMMLRADARAGVRDGDLQARGLAFTPVAHGQLALLRGRRTRHTATNGEGHLGAVKPVAMT